MFGIMSGDNRGRDPVVVKLGGSLAPHLPTLVPVLLSSPRPLLVVPGGGAFADAVRELPVAGSPDAAHWMAVAAMEQYGWLISSLGIPAADSLALPDRTRILLPYRAMREHDPLPHSWDVTSDTIAAWVAGFLSCELLVLKSVDGIITGRTLVPELHEPVQTDTVDPCFLPYVFGHRIRTFIINGTDTDRVGRWLAGNPVPGTGIGTTF